MKPLCNVPEIALGGQAIDGGFLILTEEEKEEFLEKGSRRIPAPSAGEGAGKDVQCTALISDLILTAEELGSIKRMHWSIENRLHHVLDDNLGKTARQPKSPGTTCRSSENTHTTSCVWQCTRRVWQI